VAVRTRRSMTVTLAQLSATRALLDRLIDDASLYPPAGLAPAPSLRAHGRDRESAYAFVQGRYVAPASRIVELLAAREPALTLDLSVILDVAAGADPVAGAVARCADLAPLDGAPGVAATSFELKLPDGTAAIAAMGAVIDALSGRGDLAVWFEPAYNGGWSAAPAETFAALAALRERSPAIAVGAKVRTGGLTPATVPPVDDVAAFIIAAQDAGVPWKATAGLHHPVRHVDGDTRAPMHGFLNVFVAGIALHAGRVASDGVAAILAEEDPRAFVLDPIHAAWRDVVLDVDVILAGRAQCVSFGSCSFFEPVDDLRRLGILS
jgi:hypothetical protein